MFKFPFCDDILTPNGVYLNSFFNYHFWKRPVSKLTGESAGTLGVDQKKIYGISYCLDYGCFVGYRNEYGTFKLLQIFNYPGRRKTPSPEVVGLQVGDESSPLPYTTIYNFLIII